MIQEGLQQVKKYIKYRRNAQTQYGLHSPFLYSFYLEVIRDKKNYYQFNDIKRRVRTLKKDSSIIEITDFGAGSKKKKSNKRSIKSLAKISTTPPLYEKNNIKIVIYFKPTTIL